MKLATLPTHVALLAALSWSCSASIESHASSDGRGEHDHDGHEHGEESGTELGLGERYDATRNGAHLVLAYDAETLTFSGKVVNTTERTLERVRVEVHLSNGKELGPTPAADLAPGEERAVTLKATSTDFERWNAHPEVGGDEHGAEHGDDHGHDHD